MIKFGILSVFRIMCLATLCTHKIFKRKKKKKRKPFVQVEGFKKASFFEKILPDTSSELWA